MGEGGRRPGLVWLSMTVLAAVLYHLSVLGVMFLLPLQWLRTSQGHRPFRGAAATTAVLIVAIALALKALTKAPWNLVDTVALGLPLVLIAGWVAIATMDRWGWRFLYRLLAVTAVAGLVLFPMVASLLEQPAFTQVLERSFAEVWKQAFQTPGLDEPGLMAKLDPAEFFELMKQAFLGSFLLVFFLFWAATGRIARIFESSEPKTLKDFFLPPQAAWVFLGLWGLILVQGLLAQRGVKWDLGFLQYVLLNLAWVALVVHFLAGWGILEALMDRWRWPRFGRLAVRVFLVLLLPVPGAGQIVILVGLPILAVLELWVNFRKNTQGVGQ